MSVRMQFLLRLIHRGICGRESDNGQNELGDPPHGGMSAISLPFINDATQELRSPSSQFGRENNEAAIGPYNQTINW